MERKRTGYEGEVEADVDAGDVNEYEAAHEDREAVQEVPQELPPNLRISFVREAAGGRFGSSGMYICRKSKCESYTRRREDEEHSRNAQRPRNEFPAQKKSGMDLLLSVAYTITNNEVILELRQWKLRSAGQRIPVSSSRAEDGEACRN